MGYKLAGCEVVAANDIDPEMAWHYKLNINPKHYFLCPIRDLLTAELPPVGQITLIVLMYVGRVGTITLAASLALGEHRMPYRYPEEHPIVG